MTACSTMAVVIEVYFSVLTVCTTSMPDLCFIDVQLWLNLRTALQFYNNIPHRPKPVQWQTAVVHFQFFMFATRPMMMSANHVTTASRGTLHPISDVYTPVDLRAFPLPTSLGLAHQLHTMD